MTATGGPEEIARLDVDLSESALLASPGAPGRTLWLVVPGTSQLVGVDLDGGGSREVVLGGGGDEFVAPVALDGRIYVGDVNRHVVHVVDAETLEVVEAIPVLGNSDELEVFAEDGNVWINDPYGQELWRIDAAGERVRIDKHVNVAFESSVPLYLIRGQACDGNLMRVWYATANLDLRNQLIGPGLCGGQPGPAEYVVEGGEREIIGYVYTHQVPGTLPVYDCHYPWPGSRHWQHAFSTSTHGAPWEACDLARFYVYNSPQDGTNPLYAMFETDPPPSPNVHSDGEGHVLATAGRQGYYAGFGFRVYETWYIR